MSGQSSIEWCDATWNPVRGCTKISPGCKNCYAETFAERWRGVPGHPYEQGFDLRLVPEKLDEPLRWKKPRRIFVNSMSDLFQDGAPDEFIVDVFSIMALAHWHTFQVLTKRPQRMREFVSRYDVGLLQPFMQMQNGGGISTKPVFDALDRKRRDHIEWKWPLPNVWLGVSVENQQYADERIPLLLQTPAAKRFVSYEPALGPVDFNPYLYCQTDCNEYHRHSKSQCDVTRPKLDWVIIGGESGKGARPFKVAWARAAVNQCLYAGVPPFMKQLGSNMAGDWPEFPNWDPEDNGYPLKDYKGGDMSEWPADLRVREFPR